MILDASCELEFNAPAPTALNLMLRPRSGIAQWVSREQYTLYPQPVISEFTDSLGNLCQRTVMGPGDFRIKCQCRVSTFDEIDVDETAGYMPPQFLPDAVIQFLLPSRYCPSDTLGELANEVTKGKSPGYGQCEAIRAWIHDHIKYEYGQSDATTTAADTARMKVGVCRDFSHLGISLCRAMNIPARMVVGYLYQLDPMDLHAWFEAYVGGRWYTFDATQAIPRGNRIAIAFGRDAADVALVTQFGPLTMKSMKVTVEAAPE
jgi:transglutaminase-like putative cysteine protease